MNVEHEVASEEADLPEILSIALSICDVNACACFCSRHAEADLRQPDSGLDSALSSIYDEGCRHLSFVSRCMLQHFGTSMGLLHVACSRHLILDESLHEPRAAVTI